MAAPSTGEDETFPPMGFPYLRPNPRILARLERQLAAGYIDLSEFVYSASQECVLLQPDEQAAYCKHIGSQLAGALGAHAARELEEHGGLPYVPGLLPLGSPPERHAAVRRWLAPRFRSLVAAAAAAWE